MNERKGAGRAKVGDGKTRTFCPSFVRRRQSRVKRQHLSCKRGKLLFQTIVFGIIGYIIGTLSVDDTISYPTTMGFEQ